MNDSASAIRPIKNRQYALIPVAEIQVLNPRDRDQEQFKENVRSIDEVGLRKPVVVNTHNYKRTGFYELICGQGRLEAYQALGKREIPAELIRCTRKEALLFSLVENMARVPPGTMWFAHELKRMHDDGWSLQRIAQISGCTAEWVRGYLHLVEWGEERLISGVERGVFPINFAMKVAESGEANMQNILMDAYDEGIIGVKNLPAVRKIIESRLSVGKTGRRSRKDRNSVPQPRIEYSLKDLKEDIRQITEKKEGYIRQVEEKEIRLYAILNDLDTLKHDLDIWNIIKDAALDNTPILTNQKTSERIHHE